MDPLRQLALIGLFGALGAMSRYGISLGVNRLVGESFPAGTLVVNLLGCFLLGLLAGLASAKPEASHVMSAEMRSAVMIGLLGALTTFSTFSLDAIKCFERGAHATALTYIVTSVALGLATAYAGLLLARSIAQTS